MTTSSNRSNKNTGKTKNGKHSKTQLTSNPGSQELRRRKQMDLARELTLMERKTIGIRGPTIYSLLIFEGGGSE
jgi:hypothetical protein